MNEELVSQVEDLGLSNKEARVYVANLMLGPSPVQKIGDFAGIKRVTTYVILESLVNLGLVSQTAKGKKTLFVADEPRNLKRLIEKKEEELREQRAGLTALLPQLDDLKQLPADTPEVRYYEGIEGIRSVVKDYFSKGHQDLICGFGNMDQVYKLFPEYFEHRSNPDRVSSGMKSRYIYTLTKGPILQESDAELNRESRYVPADKYPLSGDISVAGDRVAIYILSGVRPMAITIKSGEVAQALKAIFDLAWEKAKTYN